jgi:hypothetical protein
VAEGYLGFTAFNNEYGTDRHNSPGVVFNFGYNATRNLRLVGDFGFEAHDTDIIWTNGRRARTEDYQLLFGPELTMRTSPKVMPFVRGLVGLAERSYAVPTGNWICTGFSCYEDTFSVAKETGFFPFRRKGCAEELTHSAARVRETLDIRLRWTLGVQRVEDPHHERGYRELRSRAEMRKLLNRKIREQAGICAICHEEFTDYNNVVPDHRNPKGMGGAWRDDHPDNIQAVHWWCNDEKGSTRMDG